jgi:nicotinamide-nucleotide amidase
VNAEIVTVGDELLLGSTVNTNAAWLGDWLDRVGFRTRRVVIIGDDHSEISSAIEAAMETSDLVVITGGLGPTHDDITKKAIADVLGLELVVHPGVEEELRERFKRRGRRFTKSRRTMALVPEGFLPLTNSVGTAPGLLSVRKDGRRCGLLLLPGVPYEMKAIVSAHTEEIVLRVSGGIPRLHRTFRTAGITENQLEEMVRDLIDTSHSDVRFALLPDARTGVRLRVSVDSVDALIAAAHLETVGEAVAARLGSLVYGHDDDELEGVVGTLLRRSGLTLTAAESCTGGLISDRITDVPGSSDYFLGGLVAYDNSAKIGALGVSPESLKIHGAVSKQVAVEMAVGCREKFGSDIAVSATGVAGPDGGTPDKPVGTVCLGLSSEEHTVGIMINLTENRRLNKLLTSTAALNLVRKHLLRIDF